MYNERLSEGLRVVDCIDPDAYAIGAVNGDIIDMRDLRRVLFVVQVGTMAAGSTVDFVVNASTAANMANPVAITGKAITQLTQAGGDSDKQVLVEVTSEEVAEMAVGARYIQGTLTVAVDTSDAGVVTLGAFARYSPGADYDLATVDEIVA